MVLTCITFTLLPLAFGTVTLQGFGPKYAVVFEGSVYGRGQKVVLRKLQMY